MASGKPLRPSTQAMTVKNVYIIERTDHKNLPPPHGTCLDTGASQYSNPLTYYQTYSRLNCITECEGRVYSQECGCVQMGNPFRAVSPACKTSRYGLMTGCASNVSMKGKCNECVDACTVTKYNGQILAAESPYPGVMITFKELAYTEIKQSAVYTPDSLFGEIGGQLGLFLGASILSVIELLDLAVVSIWRKFCASSLKTNAHKTITR